MVTLFDAARAPEAPPAAEPSSDERRLAIGVVSAVTVAYVALTLRWLSAPLGLDHEGRNTAMFSLAARAIGRLGIVSSHAGSVLADGNGSYAHHPPLLVWAVSISQTVFGSHPWADRLPTFVASLAVIWLLFGLLGDIGLRPLAAAAGTTIAVANPMFLLYMWMSDTPMWSLPFALLATRAWVRSGSDAPDALDASRSSNPERTLLMISAALCALSGWQAVMWCALLAVAGWRQRRRAVQALLVGLAGGLVVSLGWIVASPAGLAGLLDSFGRRAAGSGQDFPLSRAISSNWTYLLDLWSPVVLVTGIFAGWLAWHDRRVRRLLVVALVGVVGYAALFWEAAGFHDYWNSWGVVIVALVFGVAADRVLARADQHDPDRLRRNHLLLVAALALAFVLAPLQQTDSQARLEQGTALGRVVAQTRLPAGQPGWLLSALSGSETWVSYASDRPVRRITSRADLLRVESAHPDWMMILPCHLDGQDRCAAMAAGGHVVNGVVVNRLSTIVDNLPPRR